jgi:hypothetical protein
MGEGEREKTLDREVIAVSAAAIAAMQLPRRKIFVVCSTTSVLKFHFYSRQ